jgi:hypothetical protein
VQACNQNEAAGMILIARLTIQENGKNLRPWQKKMKNGRKM